MEYALFFQAHPGPPVLLGGSGAQVFPREGSSDVSENTGRYQQNRGKTRQFTPRSDQNEIPRGKPRGIWRVKDDHPFLSSPSFQKG
jgi:hypothetical protein